MPNIKWMCFLLFSFIAKPAMAEKFNFKLYHALINKAELSIADGQYQQALKYYDSAFLGKKKPFALDLYNASVCAVKSNLSKQAVVYCQKLADKGVGGDFFKKNQIFTSLVSTKQWKPLLEKADQVRIKIQTKHQALLKTIDSLVEKDQKVNHNWQESGMASKEREIMELTYDTIQSQLKGIFDGIGFPSEDMIGAPLTETGLMGYRLPFDIIIIHNYQTRTKGDTLFRPLLIKALKEGLIKPEYFALMEDLGSGDNSRPYYGSSHFYVQYQCSIYLENSNMQRLADIEKARADIGLCNTQDQLKKILFNIQNPVSGFRIMTALSKIGSFGNKESEQRMLNNSKAVLNQIPDCKL